jgi:RimJ/RimL family protein N-acetyltransferase
VESLTQLISVTDGRVSIRAEDRPGAGPVAAIVAGDDVAGWVSYDAGWGRLGPGEVLVRYEIRGAHDRAFRAVQLLLHHLASRTDCRTAILRVPRGDADALALAAAAGFTGGEAVGGEDVLRRPVPPLGYTDGVVTIRRQRPDDIDRHMEAIDDEQIDWLWEPGDRQKWEAQTWDQQRAHNLAHLHAVHESFGAGPKWTFSADRADAPYVAYVDCDLANDDVPAGEANISYAGHPGHRGQGNVSRAVRLITHFLRDHTGAGSAHIVVEVGNTPSLRVARAVAATETERWHDEHGRTMIRHVLPLR